MKEDSIIMNVAVGATIISVAILLFSYPKALAYLLAGLAVGGILSYIVGYVTMSLLP